MHILVEVILVIALFTVATTMGYIHTRKAFGWTMEEFEKNGIILMGACVVYLILRGLRALL